MKEFKGTPGPWTLVSGGGSGRRIMGILDKEPSERRNMVEFTLRGDMPVTIFTDVWVQFPHAEWEIMQDANAHLIATAPELLEALIEVSDRLALYKTDRGDEEAYNQAQKAINKALGES